MYQMHAACQQQRLGCQLQQWSQVPASLLAHNKDWAASPIAAVWDTSMHAACTQLCFSCSQPSSALSSLREDPCSKVCNTTLPSMQAWNRPLLHRAGAQLLPQLVAGRWLLAALLTAALLPCCRRQSVLRGLERAPSSQAFITTAFAPQACALRCADAPPPPPGVRLKPIDTHDPSADQEGEARECPICLQVGRISRRFAFGFRC